jgi:hypothetical protein
MQRLRNDFANVMNTPTGSPSEEKKPELLSPDAARAELLTLLRLLTKNPPPDHDFGTCPICKRYGITEV